MAELHDGRTGDYRIGEGGLLRRFEVAVRLTRLHWQLSALLALTWLPTVVLGLRSGDPHALVHDSAFHVRLLIVAPLLLILDQVFPPLCRYTLEQVLHQGFVPSAARPRLDRVLGRAVRVGDSALPETLLGLFSLGLGAAALRGHVPIRGLARGVLAPDQVWYALTDLPLFQFLLWRSIWRWAIWVMILVGLARIELDLVPTHPDRCGGIRVLNLPSIGYCAMLLFALSAVLCAEWEVRGTLGATLASFGPLLFILVTSGIAFALGPLLLFVPQLFLAKKRGMLELGGLAVRYGRLFRGAVVQRQGDEERKYAETLASAEQTYRETIKPLSVFLFDRRDLAALVIATLLPVVPNMVAHVPPEDWWALLSAFTGWKP